MSDNVNNTFITGTGHIWVALKSTSPTLPVSIAALSSLDDKWVEVGYTSKDDAKFTAGQTIKEYYALQSYLPIDSRVTGATATLSAKMLEQTQSNISAAFGGGTWTLLADGAKWDPPAPGGAPVKFAVIAEIIDGDKVVVIVIANGVAGSATVDESFKQGDMLELPLTITALADNDVPLGFYKLVDNPGVEPVGS